MKKIIAIFLLVFTGCDFSFARVSGMGGFIVASVSGGQSLWLNPAGLTEGRNETISFLSLGKVYDIPMSDVGLLIPGFSSALNLGCGNTIGVGYTQVSYTGSVMKDAFDTSVLFREVSVGYSHRFGDWLSAGLCVRPYWALKSREDWYSEPVSGQDSESESATIKGTVLFDTGFIISLTETTKFGFSVFNLTRPKVYNLIPPKLPTDFNIGLSNKIWDCLTYEVVYSIADYDIKEKLDSSQVNLGIDWAWFDWLSLYGGVGQIVDSTYRDWFCSAGVEGKIPLVNNELAIGYDLNYLQETLWTHTVSLFFRFGEGVSSEGWAKQPRRDSPKPRRTRPQREQKEYDW